MKTEKHVKGILRALSHYVTFFLLVGFVITCCLTLFLNILSDSLQISFADENIALAAKLTFANVVLISLIFTLIDAVRRKLTVERPVKRILEATEKMIGGDFDVRIPKSSNLVTDSRFNEIIDCINRMAEELSGVETLRSDFISNVSHEMKTPLAVMQNYGTLLQAPELDDKKRIEYAKALTVSSRRLTDMMTNILKLSRLENQQIYPNAQTYDLGEQLCECLLQYESVWERKEIGIETDIEDGVHVCADAELLSLVWNNLFSNAFKFTESGGTVSLSLKSCDGFAVVRVSDTGCGMSPEVGAHIFEKFYQGDSSHATEGNGLGLALVKRVVDITGGDIDVESVQGVGTSFTVRVGRVENERLDENR